MPGLETEQVEEIVSIAEQAGATFVNGIALHLRPGVREVFMSWLSDAHPELVRRYQELYAGGAYAPPAERRRIGKLVRRSNRSTDPRFSRRERFAQQRAGRSQRAEREAAPKQTSLF